MKIKMETKPTIRGCQKKVKKCRICGKVLSWGKNKSGLCSHHLAESRKNGKI
jgi:hypothetical protein